MCGVRTSIHPPRRNAFPILTTQLECLGDTRTIYANATCAAPAVIQQRSPQRHQEHIHLLFYLSTFGQKEGFFRASLLLKMNLGNQLFWILGSSSTFRLLSSYKLVRVQKSKWHGFLMLTPKTKSLTSVGVRDEEPYDRSKRYYSGTTETEATTGYIKSQPRSWRRLKTHWGWGIEVRRGD